MRANVSWPFSVPCSFFTIIHNFKIKEYLKLKSAKNNENKDVIENKLDKNNNALMQGGGNEFTKVRLDSIAQGSDTFTVGGKTYNGSGDTSDEKTQVESVGDDEKQAVTEDINVSITANGEQDALNLLRKLSGMSEVPQVTSVAIPMEEEAVEEERDIELANTPHETVAPINAVTVDAGGGLGGPKKQYPLAANRGANPLEEEKLWTAYESMINDVKA